MKITLVLYHGTSNANAEWIEQHGFRFIRRSFLAYGDGVYFYSDQFHAQERANQEFGDSPCVIKAVISASHDKIRKISGSELGKERTDFNQLASREGFYVLDASLDTGIYVVRPEALDEVIVSAVRLL